MLSGERMIAATGLSYMTTATMGIVLVAFFATASACGPLAKTMLTFRRTRSSRPRHGILERRPSTLEVNHRPLHLRFVHLVICHLFALAPPPIRPAASPPGGPARCPIRSLPHSRSGSGTTARSATEATRRLAPA